MRPSFQACWASGQVCGVPSTRWALVVLVSKW
jgi:hypothetical protein